MMKTPEKSSIASVRMLAAGAICALALAAIPAAAQGTSGSSTGATGTASGAAGITLSGAPRAAGSSAGGTGAMVSQGDSKMMTDLAHANFTEIATGEMVLKKSQNGQVKKFAQHMVDDHSAALSELQTLAKAKAVKLPEGTDLKHKTMATALKAMSGNSFDSQYMKRAGVNDHQATIELLQKVQKKRQGLQTQSHGGQDAANGAGAPENGAARHDGGVGQQVIWHA